jgi:hypothetical protein
MAADRSWRALPHLSLMVQADLGLVRQLLGAVVTTEHGEMGGHRYQQVEKVSPTEAVVRFQVEMLGRDVSSTERVVLDDAGLTFKQVSGYLAAVEERIAITPVGHATQLAYSGRYQPRTTLWGRLLGPVLVPMIYRREVRKTLRSAKQMAEARQARSAMFRREP